MIEKEKLNDRGMMKWQGLMLTEHVKLIREWEKEDELVPKPELDDYEKADIANEILRSHVSGETIKLSYWKEGYIKTDYGVVIEINNQNKSIVLDNPFSTNRYKFDEIVSIVFLD